MKAVSQKTAFDVEQRPFYATEDGKGRPALDLFAERPGAARVLDAPRLSASSVLASTCDGYPRGDAAARGLLLG